MKVTKEIGTKLPDTTMSSPVYLNAKNEPFRLHGFAEDLVRVPRDVAQATSENVARISQMSAGARIRFRTDSDYIVVHGDITLSEKNVNMPEVATAGYDIYFIEEGKQVFRGIFFPSQKPGKPYSESRLRFGNDMKDVVIYLPLCTAFSEIYIGLREGSTLEAPSDYTYQKPIVFYGSSIVHGIGAMRPSSAYPSIISRRLDTDFVNLGFGGSALAEKPFMEYIASLDMSVFVYDYDHNAPTFEHLEKTHYEGYKIFRSKQPETPVIFASRVDCFEKDNTGNPKDDLKCRALIETNYKRALAEGDKNVYFIDGSKIYPEALRNECTSDTCHPNDMGYSYMANAFGAIIEKLLKK